MQGWIDFAVLATERPVNLQFLKRLQIWLSTSPFQWRFNVLLCRSQENISQSFAIAQKLGILLTADMWGERWRVKWYVVIEITMVFQQERKKRGNNDTRIEK